MKLRALFLFFVLTLVLPAVASAQLNVNTTNTSTSSATSTRLQTPPKPACVLSASPGSAYVGDTVTLTWSSRDATGGTITSLGAVGPSGKQGVIPTANANTFVGTFTGPGGTGTCSVTVGIIQGSGGAGSGATGGATTGSVSPGGSTQIRTGTGLIPCNGVDCQACDLATLGQRIINWLVGISIPLAAAMFAWAGIIYFTSGIDGGWNERTKARKIFTSVGIGFLIVLCAWLGVQTILKTILAPGFYQSWNSIQCVDQNRRPTNKTIQDALGAIPFLNSLSTKVPATTPGGTSNDRFTGGGSTGPTPSCGAGYYYSNEDGEDSCFNPDTGDLKEPTYNYSSASVNPDMAAQIAAACSQYGMDSSECAVAERIALNESSGGKNCRTSPTGAVGCYQVLPTTACSIDPTISGCSTCRSSLSAGCATVAQAIADPIVNTSLGVRYVQEQLDRFGGSCQLAAAAYYRGPGTVQRYGGVPPIAAKYANDACK